MALEETDFVVLEKGPLRGVAEATTYFATRGEAEAHLDSRLGFFETAEICKVLTRVATVFVPQTTVEGDPL